MAMLMVDACKDNPSLT